MGGVGKTTETQPLFFSLLGTFVDVENLKGATYFNFVNLQTNRGEFSFCWSLVRLVGPCNKS